MSAETTRHTGTESQIQAEQVGILFRHAPRALVTTLLLASIFVVILWGIIPHSMLIGWAAAVVAVVLLRTAVLIAYRARRAQSTAPWHLLMTTGIAGSGMIWGAAGWLFFVPEEPVALILITTALTGMASGAIPSHASWPPAQFAFALPTLLPLVARYLVEGGTLSVMGLLCLVYLFQVMSHGRQLTSTLTESLRLRIEKQELARNLEQEKLAAEHSRAKAEEAHLAKSKFLAAASHDLRQPTLALNLFIEPLRQETDPDRRARLVEHLATSAHWLEEMLDELLDMSRLEAGLLRPQHRTLAVQKVFDMLRSEWGPVAEQKGLELTFVPTRLKVTSDPQILGRVLRNLLANAIRYTERGTVLVGCRRRKGCVTISVLDTGPGIAEEHRKAIFCEFVQLGNPERDRNKGLGLGLAIADGLCRVLDHRLELHSRLRHGSAFSVTIPRAADDPAPVQSEPAIASTDLHGWRVLVIDDNANIRLAMAELFSLWGCPLITAESAAEAMAQIADSASTPDVIIADYRLRDGRTGTEAVHAIRQMLGRELPAVILTGDTASERLREASASGLPLLHKPIQPERLRATLMRMRAVAG